VEYKVSYDGVATHLDWSHEGVTAHMIDWFWSNMEKGFILWHPEQHEPLEWVIAPKHGDPIGSIHNAPQTWSDGRRQNLYIRMEHFNQVPDALRDYIIYDHVVIVAGLGLDESCLAKPDPMGYRLHQWQATDSGVVGKSTAFGTRKKETEAEGQVWAAHCGQEVGNWGVFLPDLYRLYRVVDDPKRNPFADLAVTGLGRTANYKSIPQRAHVN
jgi:hypothetical protein